MKKKICDVINAVLLSMMLVSCKDCDPSVEIDYQLDCSSTLLEYATAQVTYKGNDGVPITFTIPESEWKETDNYTGSTTSATIVINGDTIVGSETGKMMRWTKHVGYDDFSVVDDEMTVVYIPKETIPTGDAVISTDLKPTLSANVEIEDGEDTYTYMYIDLSIGVTIGSSLTDIIHGFRNYKSFHIKSDGTCEEKKQEE